MLTPPQMTVAQAIEALQKLPPEMPLALLDCDTSWAFPVQYIGREQSEIQKLHHGADDFTSDYVVIVSTNNYGDMIGAS